MPLLPRTSLPALARLVMKRHPAAAANEVSGKIVAEAKEDDHGCKLREMVNGVLPRTSLPAPAAAALKENLLDGQGVEKATENASR